MRQAPRLKKRHSISSIASSSIFSPSTASRQNTALQQARADMRAKWAGKPLPSALVQQQVVAEQAQARIRPSIVIPDAGNNASALGPPASQPFLSTPDSLSTSTPGLSIDNSSNPDALAATRSAVSPIDSHVPSIPGVLHYIDPANGKAYEVPPGMLKAFLAGAGSMGMSGWGDVGLSPGRASIGPGGSNASGTSASVAERGHSRTGSTNTALSTPFGYDDAASLSAASGATFPTRSPQSLSAPPARFPNTLAGGQADRSRMDSSSSSAFPPSPSLVNPSPSTIQSGTFTTISEMTSATSGAVGPGLPRVRERGDSSSTRTFGSRSNGSNEGDGSQESSMRRERKAGNLRERMRKMKMENQLSGGDLCISEWNFEPVLHGG